MDFRRLRYFIAAAEAEHFHHAADRLLLAQPALSRQIKLLVEELGVTLFERLGHGVRLTEAGRVFLNDTKRALLELDRAREHVRQVADGRAGTLRICFIEIASGHGVLPDTIRAFPLSHADVRLVLQPLDSLSQLAGLQEGRIDVAFLYRRSTGRPRAASSTVPSTPRNSCSRCPRVISLRRHQSCVWPICRGSP